MKSIPVDTAKTQFLIAGESRPVTDQAGQQRSNADGQPLIQVPLVAVVEGQSADTLTVKVPAPMPDLPQLTPVRVVGLVARPWSMGDKSGVSFSAVSISPLAKPQA